MEQEYAVLGFHGPEVKTVEGSVARIRMFVDGKMVDEDFTLPRLITVEEQIDTAVKYRIAEIREQGTDPALSSVIEAQVEQIVVES